MFISIGKLLNLCTGGSKVKNALPKKSKIFLAFITPLLFASCENFLDGSELKKSLETKIEYENSEVFNVNVFAANGTGSFVAGGGDKSVRVSDMFTVEFSPADDYKFIKWIAQDKDTQAELTDFIDFDAPKSLLTTVKIKKAGNIQIKPICLERPKVVEFEPQRSQAGVPKNSTITVTFSQALSLENDLSRIEISINGDSISENFNEPSLDGKSITILASNKMLEMEMSGTKTVNVKIPGGFLLHNRRRTECRNQ